MSMNINKNGQLYTQPVEPFLTLSDGSKWELLMFHLVENGTHLFTQAKAPYCNEYGLFSRLEWADDYQYDGKYEFYVRQDGAEHRWTQTSSPTSTTLSGFTVITGSPYVGLAKPSSNYTYYGYNAWWGACGCWTAYTAYSKTGIPGFGGSNANGMCTDYLALYARVENFQAFAEDNVMNENILYEY